MMSLTARRELTITVASRYKSASKTKKSQMLDEFVQSTGYNRKYAIWLFDQPQSSKSQSLKKSASAPSRMRHRKYGSDVEGPFLALWRVSGALCPKRLMPFLVELIDALERFDEIHLCPPVKEKLLTMSIATAERLLGRLRRSHERGISTTLPGTLLRQQIPIRTYEDWTENRPGFMEIDLVAHCGGTAAGDYLYTLTMTDICTGWTECLAVLNRSQIAVQAGIELVRHRLPFALLGIDCDNGSEFINHHLKGYCDEHQITFTRGRPYKKNDQCHVEQKNGAVVRPLVGYARYEGELAAEHINALYAIHRLALNYFEPSMKLMGKERVGSHVKKIFDGAKTPWERLQGVHKQDPALLPPGTIDWMRQRYLKLNPAKLRRDIEELEMGLSRLSADHSLPSTEASMRNVTIAGTTDPMRNVTIAGTTDPMRNVTIAGTTDPMRNVTIAQIQGPADNVIVEDILTKNALTGKGGSHGAIS
jgi:hypothetical protein